MEAASSTMLKPVYSTPHPVAGEMVPLTLFDRATLDIFVPIILVYAAPTPPNEALKKGLRRAVAVYPHLAGRFAVDHRGRRCIHVNNEGVLVVEAAVPVDLASVVTDGSFVTDTDELYPAVPPPEEIVGAALLQIKLNRYKCGGLVIGFSSHHQAADGYSVSTFLSTWASAVRQGRNFTAPSPFLDRAATAVARTVPTPVFDHRSAEFKGQGGRSSASPRPHVRDQERDGALYGGVHRGLKARVGIRCSTFNCLLAHAWKKDDGGARPEARRVHAGQGGRELPGQGQPSGAGGLLQEHGALGVPEASGRGRPGLETTAAWWRPSATPSPAWTPVHPVVRGLRQRSGCRREELPATAAVNGTMFCPDLEVDSSLGFRFSQIDFGGPPSAFVTPDLPNEGLAIFLPSCTASGSVDLVMAIPEDHDTATFYTLADERANSKM
ncbi:hypothetical protein ZWY2020_011536 [Hordeum vulgare]|nr:hypothetical protein ZWY2020_011536 [Hordeum vulgare]